MTEPSKTPRTDAVMAEVPAYWNNGWMAPLAALCHELETALAESQSEREEQARILGMSGEREARLMAQLSESRSEAASLREKLMEALGAAEGFRDARDAAQDRLRATTGRADLAEARCAALSVDVEAAEARMADYVRYAEELREAVLLAATTFRRYAKLHRDKGTEDGWRKAGENDKLAAAMEAAL